MPTQDLYTAVGVITMFLIGIAVAVVKTWQEPRKDVERVWKIIALRKRNARQLTRRAAQLLRG